MKKYSYLILTFLLVSVFSFSTHAQADSKNVKWTELGDFHTVFAATYYPAQGDNFEPIHSKAEELNKTAMALTNTVPKKFNTPDMTAAISELQQQTGKILASVKENAKDDVLKPELEDLSKDLDKVKSLCSKKMKEK